MTEEKRPQMVARRVLNPQPDKGCKEMVPVVIGNDVAWADRRSVDATTERLRPNAKLWSCPFRVGQVLSRPTGLTDGRGKPVVHSEEVVFLRCLKSRADGLWYWVCDVEAAGEAPAGPAAAVVGDLADVIALPAVPERKKEAP